jgi:hypothetical protein
LHRSREGAPSRLPQAGGQGQVLPRGSPVAGCCRGVGAELPPILVQLTEEGPGCAHSPHHPRRQRQRCSAAAHGASAGHGGAFACRRARALRQTAHAAARRGEPQRKLARQARSATGGGWPGDRSRRRRRGGGTRPSLIAGTACRYAGGCRPVQRRTVYSRNIARIDFCATSRASTGGRSVAACAGIGPGAESRWRRPRTGSANSRGGKGSASEEIRAGTV